MNKKIKVAIVKDVIGAFIGFAGGTCIGIGARIKEPLFKSNKEKVELFDENGKKIKQKKTAREKFETAANVTVKALYITAGAITASVGQLLLMAKVKD